MTVAALLEKFEDIFTPATSEELDDRMPEEIRGIKVGDYVSVSSPIISAIEGYEVVKPPYFGKKSLFNPITWEIVLRYGGDEWGWDNRIARWYNNAWFITGFPVEDDEIAESFEDIFQPATDDELADRWKDVPEVLLKMKPDGVTDIEDNIAYIYYNDTTLSVGEAKDILDADEEFENKGKHGDDWVYMNKERTELLLMLPIEGMESSSRSFAVRVEKNRPDDRAVGEAFKDIFQPYSPEEVEKRLPTWTVYLLPRPDKIFVETSLGNALLTIKNVKSGLSNYPAAFSRALEMVGVKHPAVNYNHKDYVWMVRLSADDNVKDKSGNPLIGLFALFGEWVE